MSVHLHGASSDMHVLDSAIYARTHRTPLRLTCSRNTPCHPTQATPTPTMAHPVLILDMASPDTRFSLDFPTLAIPTSHQACHLLSETLSASTIRTRRQQRRQRRRRQQPSMATTYPLTCSDHRRHQIRHPPIVKQRRCITVRTASPSPTSTSRTISTIRTLPTSWLATDSIPRS